LSAEDHLDPFEVAFLLAHFHTTRDAAVEAMQLQEFKEEFEHLGVRLEPAPDGRLYPRYPTRETEHASWTLVVAVWRSRTETLGDEGTEAPATLVSERYPYPKPLPKLHVRTTIQAALRRLEGKSTRAKALPEKDAIRVERMWSKGLLRLDENDHLVVDARVLQTRGLKIGLRVWDERQGRWLDPYAAL
jgi:hypothetical protein